MFQVSPTPQALRDARRGARLLATATIAAAAFGAWPAVWEIASIIRYAESPIPVFFPRWAALLLLLAAMQVAYALLLFQVPDWTSIRVITFMLLAVAVMYAIGLGMAVMADAVNWSRSLVFSGDLPATTVALWCTCMASVTALLAFFGGRLSSYWRRREQAIQQTRL
jgi:hypothetical protein